MEQHLWEGPSAHKVIFGIYSNIALFCLCQHPRSLWGRRAERSFSRNGKAWPFHWFLSITALFNQQEEGNTKCFSASLVLSSTEKRQQCLEALGHRFSLSGSTARAFCVEAFPASAPTLTTCLTSFLEIHVPATPFSTTNNVLANVLCWEWTCLLV